MKILVSVCFVALLFCLGVDWWVRPDGPSVDGRVDAVRNDEVRPGIPANRRIGSGWQSPPRWIPADAERENDQGAFLTWVATDAERDDDIGVPIRGSGHPL